MSVGGECGWRVWVASVEGTLGGVGRGSVSRVTMNECEMAPVRGNGMLAGSDRFAGTGTFGSVKLCQCIPTKEFMCVKVLSKAKVCRMKQQEHVRNEKAILSQAQHPFIVNLYGLSLVSLGVGWTPLTRRSGGSEYHCSSASRDCFVHKTLQIHHVARLQLAVLLHGIRSRRGTVHGDQASWPPLPAGGAVLCR